MRVHRAGRIGVGAQLGAFEAGRQDTEGRYTLGEALERGGKLFFQREIDVEDQFGCLQPPNVRGAGTVFVRVHVAGKKRLDLGALAADMGSNVAEHSDRGQNAQRLIPGQGWRAQGEREGGKRRQKAGVHQGNSMRMCSCK
jgi:hypothetical protein